MEIQKFSEESEKLMNRGKELLLIKPAGEVGFNQLISDKNIWIDSCNSVYTDFLPDEFAKKFIYFLRQQGIGGFVIPGQVLNVHDKLKKLHSEIKAKIEMVALCIKLAMVSDLLINPKLVKDEKRAQFKIAEKRFFILFKLAQMGGYDFYDVNYLMWANGVDTNDTELRDLIMSLENEGYVQTYGISAKFAFAGITTSGREYIEENTNEDKYQSTNESNAYSEEISNMNKKLDEVIEHLKNSNLGNEIIYEELQEMKEHGSKVNVKNWKQLLGAKLLGLAGDKAVGIGSDLAKNIFKKITDGDFTNLLS